MSRLSFESGTNVSGTFTESPVWTPDGKHLVYGSPAGIVWLRSDGAGEDQKLAKVGNPGSFSPDGKHLAVGMNSSKGGIQILPIEGYESDHPTAGKPETWLPGKGGERQPRFSPDGRWIAYASNESGTDEVYVRVYPGPGGKWQVSSGGGQYPVWSSKARELFYLNYDRRIMVVPYKVSGEALVPEKPRVWADQQISDILRPSPNFDIAPDGKRFIVLLHPNLIDEQRNSPKLTILLNFTDELRRRLLAGK
jgi:Tol biopolymer transport system component